MATIERGHDERWSRMLSAWSDHSGRDSSTSEIELSMLMLLGVERLTIHSMDNEWTQLSSPGRHADMQVKISGFSLTGSSIPSGQELST